jgi:formate hydrogenlyase subunit 6/NADH:ubiquinone oxidoreductase subunit I
LLRYTEEMCMFCAGCSAVCPPGIIVVFASHLEIEYGGCTSCGNCVKVCPAGALEL